MNKITANRQFYTTTETGRSFTDPGPPDPYPIVRPKHSDELVEADLFIYDKHRHNLETANAEPSGCDINNDEQPAQKYAAGLKRMIIPLPQPGSYASYAQTLAKQYPRLYADIATEHLQAQARDRGRSVYHISYCAPDDGIVSMTTRRRDAQRNQTLPAHWPIDTVYQTSFRSPTQIREIGDIVPATSCRPVVRDAALKAQLRKIFTFGSSEYREAVSDFGEQCMELGKYGAGGRRYGYVDRFTKVANG